MFRDKMFWVTLGLGLATLASFFLVWASPEMIIWGPLYIFGYDLSFPNNWFIVLSGVLATIFSFMSYKSSSLMRGVGSAVSGIVLMAPLYFVVTCRGLILWCGFYLGAIIYVLSMVVAVHFTLGKKQVKRSFLLGLVLTLASWVYIIMRVRADYGAIGRGFPLSWFTRGFNIYDFYSLFLPNFLFDFILWFTVAWLLMYIYSEMTARKRPESQVKP